VSLASFYLSPNMGKPVILAVDDDPEVLASVQRDLRAKYSSDYRIVGVSSGREALETLNELTASGDQAAMLVVDQRMPEMTGVEFLEAARRLAPLTRRVLLTAYADTEAAINAINRAGVSFYILKPWTPPEEKLYPILDDELMSWRSTYRPGFGGVRVIGDRWSASTHRIKELLARNQVPYSAIDAGGAEGQLLLEAIGVPAGSLPVVLLEGGEKLVQPTLGELASAVHLHTRPQLETYDLVIVGAGPAGLAAAVYGASEGLKVVVVDGEGPGGQASQSAKIENYLGFPAGLSGADLTRRAVAQATRFSAEMLIPVEAVALERHDPFRVVRFGDGTGANCKAVLIATGVSYRMLPAQGADRFAGAGVYYGASGVEATEYADQDVAVVGGGNSAGQAALYLAATASAVRIIIRGPDLTESMSAYLVDRIAATPNIEVVGKAEVLEVEGDAHVTAIEIEGPGGRRSIPIAAVFVYIGQAPRTEWLGDQVQRDDHGFVLTGNECTPGAAWTLGRQPLLLETSLPGVFAAGDVRAGSIKRVASAAGEGAMAVRMIHEHLASL
jgi:thioredoxin reductase (NADPH)